MANGSDHDNEPGPQAAERELDRLEQQLEELRIAYDQYFVGQRRVPPERERAQLERDLRSSRAHSSNRAAVRFRLGNLRQRLGTYARRWDRLMRMVEEGHLERKRGALSPRAMLGRNRSNGPRAEGAGQSAGDARASGGDDEPEPPRDPVRKLYEDWRRAHQEIGRDPNVDFERFRARIERQRSQQVEKYGWRDVSYDVRVRDGRVRLVARPVKGESGGSKA